MFKDFALGQLTLMATTGEKIAALRKKLGLSQFDLGERTGIKQKRISMIEADEGRAYADQAKAIADALKVPVAYLLDDSQTEPPTQPKTEIEARVWEVVKTIGPEAAWDRLVGKPWIPVRIEQADAGGKNKIPDK